MDMNDQPPSAPADDFVDRLSRVRGVRHAEDERPNREEIEAKGHVVYPGPPVPLPRWLWGGKRKKRSG
jgi:hypothetical protein